MISLTVQDDLVVGIVTGDGVGLPLPETMSEDIRLALAGDIAARRDAVARLRIVAGEVVDVGPDPRTFYVDEMGAKHIVDAAGRSPLLCSYDAEVEPDGAGGWRIVDQLARLKERRKSEIDAEAERQRLRWITPGAGQAMTYARKVEQAKAVLVDHDSMPADYPMLAASIGIDGADLLAVANLVIAMDQSWEQIGAAIEQARLGAKKAVDAAGTISAANAVEVIWPGA
ncbi:hypothetical protein [Bosea sp. (in: a-proteobacteria)]